MKRIFSIGLLFCCLGGFATSNQDVIAMAKKFELTPSAKVPDWAAKRNKAEALSHFVWFSDLHLDHRKLVFAKTAFVYMNGLAPDFFLVTGDNCAFAPKNFRPDLKERNLRRQTFFKHLVDSLLKAPAVVLPGDNWPLCFDQVFGAKQFCFNAGGVRFVCISMDRRAKGVEGTSVFSADTWSWLDKELKRSLGKPVVLVTHENIYPPTFLDAGRLEKLLLSQKNVLGTFTGHLHLDIAFQHEHLRHIVCPALATDGRFRFKEVWVYKDAIHLQTHEYDLGKKQLSPVGIYQRIVIPEALQGSVPATATPVKQNIRPVHPMLYDQNLVGRSAELVPPLMSFVFEFGMQSLLPSPTPLSQPKVPTASKAEQKSERNN